MSKLLQIQQEKVKYQGKIRELCVQYEYYNEFNFTKRLGEAISHLITKMEGKEYVCRIVGCTIKEHEEDVFCTPGKYIKKTIPEEKIPYFILMEQGKFQYIEQKFSDKSHIEEVLKEEASVYSEYFGVVNIKLFSEYPYLHKFFNLLNEWRYKNGRVTLDEDVIDESVDKVLDNQSTTGKKARQKVRSYKG